MQDDNPQPVSSKQRKASGHKGCLDKFGNCQARFPHTVVLETLVDLIDGHILMKKLEPMMNTFTPQVFFLGHLLRQLCLIYQIMLLNLH